MTTELELPIAAQQPPAPLICIVCGDPACDHRCNPIVAAGWDALGAMLQRLKEKKRQRQQAQEIEEAA
jgi:hypothetical protein